MARSSAVSWVAVAAAVAAGCAVHWDVESYAVPGSDVASRQTYFWKGGDFAAASQLDPATIATAAGQVRSAVVEELARKGFREVASAEAADLVASFQVSGMRRFVVDDSARVGAPSPNTVLSPSAVQPPPASSVPREVPVREGSVIVFLDDPKLGKLAWRGEVAEQIRASSPEQVARIIAQMAREIAKEVPARSGR
ncbi:MAG: hypothetical protein K0R70_169 [Steroidobacteraceae bacterium]|nr:hypothetical protein [Steroidobacteraceae bacterium]